MCRSWSQKRNFEYLVDDFFTEGSIINRSSLESYIYTPTSPGLFKNLLKQNMLRPLNDLYSNTDSRFRDELDKFYIDYMNLSSTFFKAYVLLRGYHFQKDNFENFKVLLDDLKYYKSYYMRFDPNRFRDIMNMLDTIVANKNYKDLKNTRAFLKNLYERMDARNFDDLDFSKAYNKCFKVYEDAEKLEISYDKATEIFDKLMANALKNRVIFNNSELVHYSKILLIGDRFDYFNERLIAIERNHFIREDIVSKIDTLEPELFNELNSDNSKDSFITCMDSLFDSDSYLEFSNKLNLLMNSSELYRTGKKEEAFSLLKGLNDSELKKTYLGKRVEYPKNTMNKIEKAWTILYREEELYERIDETCSFKFNNSLSSIYFNARSLEEAVKISDNVTNSLQQPLNKFKRKAKIFLGLGKDNF